MITAETFAQGERKLGKSVHLHDGVWWIKTAPLYYKPIHDFQPIKPKTSKPHPLRALMGYSHQVADPTQATHHMRWNILQGPDLHNFTLERLPPAKRRVVRQGIRNCRVELLNDLRPFLTQLTNIAISQAVKHEEAGGDIKVLPPSYYYNNASRWQEQLIKVFNHKGHQFFGAFVQDKIVAYVDLIRIEDTWIIGTVKSHQDYLGQRPIDALYYTILSNASRSNQCARVINGGGVEREGVTRFKEQFFFRSINIPYFSNTLFSIEILKKVRKLISV